LIRGIDFLLASSIQNAPVPGFEQGQGIGRGRELMHFGTQLAMLFVVLALAGCASMAAGPGQTPNAPYQQSDPRDTSGMH